MKTKLAALAVLALAFSVKATVTETLGVGPMTGQQAQACSYSGVCIAPVLRADGTPNGTIEIHAGPRIIHRVAQDGITTLWDSTDFDATAHTYSHDGLTYYLSYTGGSHIERCGGSAWRPQVCNYHWISGGTLTE